MRLTRSQLPAQSCVTESQTLVGVALPIEFGSIDMNQLSRLPPMSITYVR